jgi:hypothetical protein
MVAGSLVAGRWLLVGCVLGCWLQVVVDFGCWSLLVWLLVTCYSRWLLAGRGSSMSVAGRLLFGCSHWLLVGGCLMVASSLLVGCSSQVVVDFVCWSLLAWLLVRGCWSLVGCLSRVVHVRRWSVALWLFVAGFWLLVGCWSQVVAGRWSFGY